MMEHVKTEATFVKHPTQEGVFLKHFFGKEETDGRLNNMEVQIMPGYQIAPHVHADAGEFFYVVSGAGAFLDQTQWKPIQKGEAFQAPMGMTHAIQNTGKEVLVLFSTFSPPTR